MSNLCRLAITLILLSWASVVSSQEGDKEAILTIMQKAFDAVASGNPKDWQAIQLSQGTTLSMRESRQGQSKHYSMRIAKNEDYVAKLKPTKRKFAEHWTEEPTILVHGAIAVVWESMSF